MSHNDLGTVDISSESDKSDRVVSDGFQKTKVPRRSYKMSQRSSVLLIRITVPPSIAKVYAPGDPSPADLNPTVTNGTVIENKKP